jgi:hypothetical protein
MSELAPSPLSVGLLEWLLSKILFHKRFQIQWAFFALILRWSLSAPRVPSTFTIDLK